MVYFNKMLEMINVGNKHPTNFHGFIDSLYNACNSRVEDSTRILIFTSFRPVHFSDLYRMVSAAIRETL